MALRVNAQEQVQAFKTEVEFIASALGHIGQKAPLGSKFLLVYCGGDGSNLNL